MSRLNRIQNELKQLEGGKFQKLCDEYLYRKMNWDNIVSLGSMEGTDKTTIGNPDAYNFSDQLGQYIFVMSGTRKNSTTKLKLDIRAAIIKTQLEKKIIQEIICCHTSSNLTVKSDYELRELAKPAKLTLIGIDTLAQDLLQFKYQDIVREFLGITDTTDQVWTPEQFIAIHDKSKTNVPLNVEYIGDRSIIHKLIDDLNNNQILLLTGKPGTGKTKLAVEMCKDLSDVNNIVCVKSNSMPIYQEIKDALEMNRMNYLFLDNVNTINNFSAIINLLKLKGYEQNLKIIITVREYALSEIMDIVQSFATRIEKVLLMEDFKISLLIKNVFPKIQTDTTNKITNLAHGNPRIAVLAAIREDDNSNNGFLENSKGILEIFYNQILSENSISKEEKLVLFILSFINKVDLEKHELLNEIISFFGLDVKTFIEVVNQLHDKGLCGIFQKRITQVCDQSLSDFVLIEFISNNQVYKIRDFFNNFYPTYIKEIIEMIARIDEHDSSKEWSEYLDNEIKYVNFALIKEENREEFLINFAAFVPAEAFAYTIRKIQELEIVNYNVTQKDFHVEEGTNRITDPIIKMLNVLSKNGHFKNAGKLLIKYLNRRPDKLFEIFVAIKTIFNIEYDWDDYLVKRNIIFEIFSNQKNVDESVALLIVNTAKEFLKLSEEKSISNVAMLCSSYRLLQDEKYLIAHHKNIFEMIFKIYFMGYKEANNVVDHLLINYPVSEVKNFFIETVVSDLTCIGNLFFEDIFNLTIRQESILSKLQTEINKYELRILPYLNYEISNRQKIYKIFSNDQYSLEMKEFGFGDSKLFRIEMLKKIFIKYCGNFEELFNILSEYQSDELLNNSEIEESIFFYYSIVEKNEKVEILMALLKSKFLISFSPIDYMNQLSFEEGKHVLREIYKEVDIRWKITNMLTCEFIKQDQTNELALIIKNIQDNKVFDSFDILSFENYINHDDSILELLLDCFEEDKISNNFFISKCENKQVFKRIKKIIGMEKLEKLYLNNLGPENIDYSGRIFRSLLKEKGHTFAYSFILKLHSLESFYAIHNYYDCLKDLWNLKDIEKVIGLYFDFLIEQSSVTYYGIDYTLRLILILNIEGSTEFIVDEIFKTNDEVRLVNLYNVILEIYDEETIFVLFQLLKKKKISDESFKKINLTRSMGLYNGSLVPTIERNIRLLNSLLLVFEDIEFISYSCIIAEYIEYLKLFKESNLIDDFVE